jgi:hypothetical protein
MRNSKQAVDYQKEIEAFIKHNEEVNKALIKLLGNLNKIQLGEKPNN